MSLRSHGATWLRRPSDPLPPAPEGARLKCFVRVCLRCRRELHSINGGRQVECPLHGVRGDGDWGVLEVRKL